MIHRRSRDSRLFIYKTNKRNILLHNVFTSFRVFAALVSVSLVARVFAVAAMTFPSWRWAKIFGFHFRLPDVLFLFGNFPFLHSIKNSESLWRALQQPLGEYTREKMKQKSKTLTHSSTTLSHTRAQAHWTREKIVEETKDREHDSGGKWARGALWWTEL